MIRENIMPRLNWEQKVEDQGLSFHHTEEGLYWDESACYKFTEKQIDDIDDSTQDLHDLCLKAVDEVIKTNRLNDMGINPMFHNKIKESWKNKEPSLYGRFDLYLNDGKLKMLEYNADTPTALLEASVIQWEWKQDVYKKYDQFNSIQEKLYDQLSVIMDYYKTNQLHLTCVDESEEDAMTTGYIATCAQDLDLDVQYIDINDIGYDHDNNQFVDLNDIPIELLFKLYPLEWMADEYFGKHLLDSNIKLIEPYWKMILSNKAILPILWEMAPNHQNLLPSYFYDDRHKLKSDKYIVKPFYSREGNNLTIIENGIETYKSKDSGYNSQNLIVQQYFEPKVFETNIPVIGSWVIGDKAAGIGIREDNNIITSNFSRFVPHYFI